MAFYAITSNRSIAVGSLIKQKYTKLNPKTGKRETHESRKWYCQYKSGGHWIRKAAYTDKAASQQMLARLEREAALGAEGISEERAQQRRRPIEEHAGEFRQHLEDRGNTAAHVKQRADRVGAVLESGRIRTIDDLTPARVDSALAELGRAGLGIESRNHYLSAVKAFSKWLVKERRLAENPLIGMDPRNADKDRRMLRRAITDEELAALVAYTAGAKALESLSGIDRAMLYLLAGYTGYRRNELGSITPESFEFGPAPSLTVLAGVSKRRRKETIPLRTDMAAMFEPWIQGKPPGVAVFEITDGRVAEMIRADLDGARGVWIRGAKGKKRQCRESSNFLSTARVHGVGVDFHSLRSTFITSLSKSGVKPKVAQILARHSTIDLTMQTYTHLEASEQRLAVESMPPAPVPKSLPKGLHKARSRKGTKRVTKSK